MKEAEAKQNLLGELATVVATKYGDMLGEVIMTLYKAQVGVGLVVGAVGYLVGKRLKLSLEVVDMGEGLKSDIEHRARVVGNHLLRTVADGLSRSDDDGAALGFLLTTENLQEGRFARTILAHETNAVVVGDVEGDRREEVLASELD